MTALAIGTGRAVEVLHDRGPAPPAGGDRWTGGSGYLIGSGLVLTAGHNVDYRRDVGAGERLLVRTIDGDLLPARVVLACDELSGVDLALLEISDPRFGAQLPPVTFARVDRDSPAPVTECWAVGFPRFGEAGPVLPGGSRRETWQVSVCVPRIPSTGSDLQGCSSSRPAVRIIDHVPSVRLPPEHTDDILAAGVPA